MAHRPSAPGPGGCLLGVVVAALPIVIAVISPQGAIAVALPGGSDAVTSQGAYGSPGGGSHGNGARGLHGFAEGPRAQGLAELPWTPRRVARVPGATFVPRQEGQPFDAIRLEHKGPGKVSARLLLLPSPKVRHRRYALIGRVRVADVQGEGYLEMWSHFPERGRFFSRTLAPDGPLQSLSGTQPWRRFALPFDASGSPRPPTLIELNVVLPGPGTVWLGPLRLVDLEDGPAAPMGPRPQRGGGGPPPPVPPWRLAELWWSPGTGGWVGAVGGTGLGVLGVLLYVIGIRPRRLRLVGQIVLLCGLLGSAGILLGVVAVLRDQPYDVYYPLLLLGGLACFLAVLGARLGRRMARGPRYR